MNARKGLSLLETIASIFLISMVILMLVQLFPTSFLASRRSLQHGEAGRLAEEVLAQKRVLPFHELVVGEETLEDVVKDGVSFSRKVRVYDLEEANPDKLKGIRVEVGWQERGMTWTVERDYLQVKLPR